MIELKKVFTKKRKVFVAFMDMKTAYDRINWEAVWDVLNVYCVDGKFLYGLNAFNMWIEFHCGCSLYLWT